MSLGRSSKLKFKPQRLVENNRAECKVDLTPSIVPSMEIGFYDALGAAILDLDPRSHFV